MEINMKYLPFVMFSLFLSGCVQPKVEVATPRNVIVSGAMTATAVESLKLAEEACAKYGKHAIFGKVIEGMDVAVKISQVPRDSRDKPLEEVKLESVEIVSKFI